MTRIIVLLISMLLVAAAVFAQGVQTGSVRGVVRDAQRLPLPGATVTAVSSSLQGGREAVADAEAGLAHLQGMRKFGLLITDQRLSGAMTGLDLIRAIRAVDADAPPAIIITGEVDSPLLHAAAREDVMVLHKPVRVEQLRQLLGSPRHALAT